MANKVDFQKVVVVLTPEEASVIYHIRETNFGKVTVQVQNGKPIRVEHNSSTLVDPLDVKKLFDKYKGDVPKRN